MNDKLHGTTALKYRLEIKPTIGEYQSVVQDIRKEGVVSARIRLGHTRVTHSYLLLSKEQPHCFGCLMTLLP